MKTSPLSSRKTSHAAALSIFLSPGLLIIDHIHFQYNGFLYGILILSIVVARKPQGLLLSGLLFAVLLCLKHIYLYLAPAYFVYLLRVYCVDFRVTLPRIRFFNCVKLGVCILATFALAFGPFVYWGQMEQLLSRLFPFSRGLCHAYWAPNVWAMYSFTDRVLIYRGFSGKSHQSSRLTYCSRSISKAPCEPGSCEKRYQRACWRHCLCSTSRHPATIDLCSDISGTSSEYISKGSTQNSRLIIVSLHSSQFSLSSRPGNCSSALSRSADMHHSSLAGMCTKRQSYWC